MASKPAEVGARSFFATNSFDLETFDRCADQAFASAAAHEAFAAELERLEAGGGRGEALRIGLGRLILGQPTAALEWLAKAADSGERFLFTGEAEMALCRWSDAAESYRKAASKGWDGLEADMKQAVALVHGDDLPAARKLLDKHEQVGRDRASWYFASGVFAETDGDRDAAVELYEKTLTLDPDHVSAMFRCAWLYDLRGDDDLAVELYHRCALQPRASVNALINLAVIYEDTAEYEKALNCLQRVLTAFPEHPRARLFLRDVQSSQEMIIDDNVEQKIETRNRLLETPVTEFELSVRARNCLKKMKVQTLGELLRLSEDELMAYKNFGEASLTEIKAMLSRRGLRLGQRPEEIDPSALAVTAPPSTTPKVVVPPGSEAILSKPVSELELSVRARRCLQRHNITTLGDLIQHSEQELLSTRNFGVTSLSEIKARIADFGLSLAPRQ